jgi:hypothetical protein
VNAICVAIAVVHTAFAWPAHAEPTGRDTAAGATSLRHARTAWETGSLETAEPFYREAIELGGLAPSEVLEGYVRLGAIRSALGKKEPALAAFRAASVIDADFTVPKVGGAKSAALASRAKKETSRIGSVHLAVRAPKEVPAGKAFSVTAELDPRHVAIVAGLRVLARDGTSGKETTAESAPGESVALTIPADVTMPSASLVVRVDALDKQGNRLATAEERVHVAAFADPNAEPIANVDPQRTTGSGVPSADPGSPAPASPPKRPTFWSSPWPYIVGGAALASAGTAVFFGANPTARVPATNAK